MIIQPKFKDLIGNIWDKSLLAKIYEFVTKALSKEGEHWEKLTPKQQKEGMVSFEESRDPHNIISHEEVKKEMVMKKVWTKMGRK